MNILALSGAYGTIAFIANTLTTMYLTDQWGRRKCVQFYLPSLIRMNLIANIL
jgi:hypothetical protein